MKGEDLKSAFFLYNKGSGLVRRFRRKRVIVRRAKLWGWNGEVVNLSSKSTAGEVIENIGKKKISKTVVFCGGDGTVHSGLRSALKHDLTMGIFPMGSGNVLARNLGIALNLKKAVDDFFSGGVKKVDVGLANDEPFLLSASMGVAADVMMMTKRKEKKVWGRWAYMLSVIKAISMPSRIYEVKVENNVEYNGKAKGVWVINVEMIGGVSVAGGGHMSSGDLRLGVLTTDSFWSWVEFVFHLLRGRPYNSRFYRVLTGKSIDIAVTDGRAEYECDGTVKGRTSLLRIRMLDKKAKIIVPNSRLKRVVIFDFDGTIADTFPGFLRAINSVLVGLGLPELTDEDVKRLRTLGIVGVIKEFKSLGLNLANFTKKVKKEYFKENRSVELFAGVLETTEKLARHCEIGIVTSNNLEFVKRVLMANNMTKFSFVRSEKNLFGKGKAIEKIIRENNYDKNQIVYVGDEARDVVAAKQAGIFSVGVTWGYDGEKSLARSNPDVIVSKIGQLESVLVKWANGGQ